MTATSSPHRGKDGGATEPQATVATLPKQRACTRQHARERRTNDPESRLDSEKLDSTKPAEDHALPRAEFIFGASETAGLASCQK